MVQLEQQALGGCVDLISDFFANILRLVFEIFAQFQFVFEFLLKLLEGLRKIVDLSLHVVDELLFDKFAHSVRHVLNLSVAQNHFYLWLS